MPQPVQSLADHYDLGDTAVETTSAVAPPPAESVSPPQAASSRPRDPDSGRFLPSTTQEVIPESGYEHSRQTLRMAGDLGIPVEEIKSTPPDVLDERVYQRMLAREQSRREQSQAAALDSSRTAPQSSSEPRGSPDNSPATTPQSDLGLPDEADYDPGLVKVLRRLHEENRALKSRLDEVHGFQRARVQQSLNEQIDSAFAEHAEHLGDGPGHKMQPDDPFFMRRKAVLQLVDQLPKQGTLQQRITKAVGILYGVTSSRQTRSSAETEIASPERPSEQQWHDAALARPTHRKQDVEPRGPRRAERAVAEYQRQQSESNTADANGDDFLPGPG